MIDNETVEVKALKAALREIDHALTEHQRYRIPLEPSVIVALFGVRKYL